MNIGRHQEVVVVPNDFVDDDVRYEGDLLTYLLPVDRAPRTGREYQVRKIQTPFWSYDPEEHIHYPLVRREPYPDEET